MSIFVDFFSSLSSECFLILSSPTSDILSESSKNDWEPFIYWLLLKLSLSFLITKSIMAELLLSKLFINDNIPSSSNKFLLIWDWLFVVLLYAVDDKISKKNIIVINFNGFKFN